MERTISAMVGKGSSSHNSRTFTAENVDKERSKYNVEFINEDIKKVYHKLFDGALERYNAKQKRKDRKIDDYYEKIKHGNQEKLFYEVIFQIGNKDDMNAQSLDGELAQKILSEFTMEFEDRNTNLYVFSAHLHMDEKTPHVHIDFIPYVENSKRGLDTRVSLKGALAEQGFRGGTRGDTEWNQWITSEKEELAKAMKRYGIDWLKKGTHEKHLSVLDYKKQERLKEVEKLEKEIIESKDELKIVSTRVALEKDEMEELIEDNNSLRREQVNLMIDNDSLKDKKKELQIKIDEMGESIEDIEKRIREYELSAEYQIPEPSSFMSAKTYRDSKVKPFVKKLIETMKQLAVKCRELTERVFHLTEKVRELEDKNHSMRKESIDNAVKMYHLEEQAEDFQRVKDIVGADKIEVIINHAKELEGRSEDDRYNNR